MNILVINGPNLNLLGLREPEIYGSETLEDLGNWLDEQSDADGHEITWFQSNHEGDLIDQIQTTITLFDGIILNPGAFTHYSYAIRDAISSVKTPTVEVHLSDINSREEFRKTSVIKDECISQISGLGKQGYLEALKTLINYI
ncbi:MAG: type II 3-dehydroquinate dehydratase [Candidatus Marinimicrobia bacterium]|jgi:3-dehydroquinate dehydratase-2|nr:type II 3-dehydroquinate dehydratase [Candidatus Neomarinimicrobiota bacterium]MBT3945382.1 type II 3-dehydroquinate dehydratase [Candidatus Neomarinimicrobiota bacterium]MBT4155267.1 type II 3-dehydroquinate dehydratase [Candidatus Neomarinimicrobiota bacterium]MBT4554570.1 type II 3-dehydroquinate dehydratase [Candidatus Neomarinimicrobiota bacterium]MBT4752771.1 type II 3-dehydroquinate dehydratase [Candidatus Neomarinimicrobiota bacterium]|tara:strand:+ start:3008 stop:3436 length:429 start_codon:yes stop_codon:yes gene_type:complete